MKKKLSSRLGDISKIMNRAAFADVDSQIVKYKYGSDAFMRILESRYSCHAFTNAHVSDSKLKMILEAGRMAPSAMNLQPTRVWVIKSEEALARLRDVHPCYGAPVVLVVGCRNEEAWTRESDGVNAAKTDAAIVLAHLMLTATDAGLANMWIWDFDPGKIREAFPEMKNHGIYGLLAIGHPAAHGGKPTELHTSRKSLEEMVVTL
ncbi:MAG: nitroreductase family protein [Bacteroidales bacterium]|nr:nitroreductase family protein [Bacteroidales bacterium]